MKHLLLITIVFISFKSAAQVTSVAGTANQIIASGLTGAITLSTPQDLGISSTVRFGRMGIGGAPISSAGWVNRTRITGSTSATASFNDNIVESDVTSYAYGFRSDMGTVAAPFTLSNLTHFIANQQTFGAGSVVTTQVGFRVTNAIVGAANNYAFQGQITAATGRWNLYMSGTAANYLAGNLGIGTTTPTEKLSVNGNIRAKEIKVEASPWPDYVFHKSYSLQPLSEVEKFIQTNQHLPGIPSASEIEKDGLHLGEMNAKLLKKIEELTLYLIEQQKQTEKIKQEQGARIIALEKALLAGRKE